MESGEYLSNRLWVAKVSNSIGYRIMVFESEERRQFVLIEFFHSTTHVVRKDKIEKDLLSAIKMRADLDLGF